MTRRQAGAGMLIAGFVVVSMVAGVIVAGCTEVSWALRQELTRRDLYALGQVVSWLLVEILILLAWIGWEVRRLRMAMESKNAETGLDKIGRGG